MDCDTELRSILYRDLLPLLELLADFDEQMSASEAARVCRDRGATIDRPAAAAELLDTMRNQREDLEASLDELSGQLQLVLSRSPLDEDTYVSLRGQQDTLRSLLAVCERIHATASSIVDKLGAAQPGKPSAQKAVLLRASA